MVVFLFAMSSSENVETKSSEWGYYDIHACCHINLIPVSPHPPDSSVTPCDIQNDNIKTVLLNRVKDLRAIRYPPPLRFDRLTTNGFLLFAIARPDVIGAWQSLPFNIVRVALLLIIYEERGN
jgi:hypothetical protein